MLEDMVFVSSSQNAQHLVACSDAQRRIHRGGSAKGLVTSMADNLWNGSSGRLRVEILVTNCGPGGHEEQKEPARSSKGTWQENQQSQSVLDVSILLSGQMVCSRDFKRPQYIVLQIISYRSPNIEFMMTLTQPFVIPNAVDVWSTLHALAFAVTIPTKRSGTPNR